jgi:hypothetical protein
MPQKYHTRRPAWNYLKLMTIRRIKLLNRAQANLFSMSCDFEF